jgi:hypothetical protein
MGKEALVGEANRHVELVAGDRGLEGWLDLQPLLEVVEGASGEGGYVATGTGPRFVYYV